eukprot:TRINITY_DN3627_c0_g1_i1.p1 TRINITY_DN3627_c0_g1~~TRINITY_DN3627_c0_g1_i1.p1  ORF type:complete len:1288 (+),score=174.99 TRINITY_DN3627_c0_g1_i1:27-3866(+)
MIRGSVACFFICVVVITFVLCTPTEAQDIQFWTGMTFSGQNTVTATNSLQTYVGVSMAFAITNRNPPPGVLSKHNLTISYLDDGGNNTRLINNVNQMIDNPDNLAILFSSNTDASIQIQSLIGNSTPFVNPLTSANALRIPFQRNIINWRSSVVDEVYGCVTYLTNVLYLTRISVFYSPTVEGAEAFDFLNQLLPSKGLRIVSQASSSEGDIHYSLQKLRAGSPQAILIWADIQSSIEFVDYAPRYIDRNTLMFLSYDSAQAGVELTQSKFNYTFDFPYYFGIVFPTTLDDNPISIGWNKAVAEFSGSSPLFTPANLLSIGCFEGYIIGRWITQILKTIDKWPISREDFLKSIYTQEAFRLDGGFQVGPMVDQTDGIYELCNKVSHRLQLIETFGRGATTITFRPAVSGEITWNTCTPPFDLLPPINFVCVYDENDVNIQRTIQGIELAFRKINALQPITIRPLQLITAPKKNSSFANATKQLLIDNQYVIGLVGYSEEAALDLIGDADFSTLPLLVDPVSGLQAFRDFNINILNLRAGTRDQVSNILYYLNKSPGSNVVLYYRPDQQGQEFYDEVMYALGMFQKYGGNNINLVGAMTSTEVATMGLSTAAKRATLSRTINWLILCTKEGPDQIVNITQTINDMQDISNPVSVIITLSEGTGFDSLAAVSQRTRSKAMISNYYPLSGSYILGNVDLLGDYIETSKLWNTSTTEQGLSGYFTGLSLKSITKAINGEVDPSNFRSTIFQEPSNYIFSDGIQLGPYLNDSEKDLYCNQGTRFTGLYTTENFQTFLSDPIAVYNTSWGTCGVDYATVLSTPGGSSERSLVVLAIALPIAFCLACFVLCVVIGVLAFVLIWTRPDNKKQRYLKELRYNRNVVKDKFADRQNIDIMFISSMTDATSQQRREMLDLAETFILQPPRIYPVIAALTKAGLAREDVASCVIYIYQANGLAHDLFQYAIFKEFEDIKDETTMFREDSLLGALWLAYTRLIGLSYLWEVLSETIYDIIEVNKGKHSKNTNFEIDIMTGHNLNESGSHESYVHMLHLKLASQTILNRMRSTPFPADLSKILSSIANGLREDFQDLRQGVIANYVLLRFICLAVASPNHYGLWKDTPGEDSLRFLVITSKVIQNVGFGVEFEKTESLVPMNDLIRQNKDSMAKWLESTTSVKQEMDKSGEGGTDDEQAEMYPLEEEVIIDDMVKSNCVKWLYTRLRMNRQVLRRELQKKLGKEEYMKMCKCLENMSVFTSGSGTDVSDTLNSRRENNTPKSHATSTTSGSEQ